MKRNFKEENLPRKARNQKDKRIDEACAYLRLHSGDGDDVSNDNAIVFATELLAVWERNDNPQKDRDDLYRVLHDLIWVSDLHATNRLEQTALHIAIDNGLDSLVPLLISGGCNVDAKDCDGGTPLQYAVAMNSAMSVRLLTLAGASIDYLLSQNDDPFCGCDDIDIVAALISAGANVNRLYDCGFRPLHWAVKLPRSTNRIKLVEFLLSAGAAIDARAPCPRDSLDDDDFAQTALMQAALHSNVDAVKMLIVAGADVDALDARGYSACYLASNHDVVRLLVAANTDKEILKRLCLQSRDTIQSDALFDPKRNAKGDKNNDPKCWNWTSAAILLAAGLRASDIQHCCRRLSWESGDWEQVLFDNSAIVDIENYWSNEIAATRNELSDLIFKRLAAVALDICCALQTLELPALVTLYIIDAVLDAQHGSYGLIPMHLKWKLITAVKHF